MRFAIWIFVAVFFKCCFTSDQSGFQICQPNTICSQERGSLSFNWWRLTAYERHMFRGRTWSIRPTTGSSVTIAFKDLNIEGNLYIAIRSDGNNLIWRKISRNLGRNVELIYDNVTSITIYMQRSERGSFKAQFYIGCTILTSDNGEITYPSEEVTTFESRKCWVLKPAELKDLSRVYLTFRDVFLKQGSSLKVSNLNTDQSVSEIGKSVKYDVYEVNVRGQEAFLIELTCGGTRQRCFNFGNTFSLSYYSLDRRDVSCVEIKRLCVMGKVALPKSLCYQSCPKLDQILAEEIRKEGPVYPEQPMVKSGIPPRRAGLMRQFAKQVNETEEKRREEEAKKNKKEKKDEEEEEEEEEEAIIPCNLPESYHHYCRCLRNETMIWRYCIFQDCEKYNDCAGACFMANLFFCKTVKSSTSVTLIGG